MTGKKASAAALKARLNGLIKVRDELNVKIKSLKATGQETSQLQKLVNSYNRDIRSLRNTIGR
jgi:hypothetical protein